MDAIKITDILVGTFGFIIVVLLAIVAYFIKEKFNSNAKEFAKIEKELEKEIENVKSENHSLYASLLKQNEQILKRLEDGNKEFAKLNTVLSLLEQKFEGQNQVLQEVIAIQKVEKEKLQKMESEFLLHKERVNQCLK